MAKLKRLELSNQKRLYITQFFSEYIEDEEENEKIYITIKKLPYSIKKKIEFLSFRSKEVKMGKALISKADEKGIDLSEIKDITNQEALLLTKDVDITSKELDEMNDIANETTKLILNNGIDSLKHNIEDENGEKINLDYDMLDKIGSEKMVEHIIKAIESFSKGFFVEK